MSLGNLVRSFILGASLVACGGNSSNKPEEPVEYRTSCVDDNDCHSMERCIEDLCDLPPNEPEPEPIPEPEVDKYATDWCDGIDNNGNGLVDEIGCGTLYLQKVWQLLSLDLKTGVVDELYDAAHLSIEPWRLFSMSPDHKKIALFGSAGLYVYNIENREINHIVHTAAFHSYWSSNNDIAYCGRHYYPYFKTIKANGDDDRIILQEFPKNYWECRGVIVTPNQETYILMMSLENEGPGYSEATLVVDRDGSNQRILQRAGWGGFGWIGDEFLYGCDTGTCASTINGNNRTFLEKYFLISIEEKFAFAEPRHSPEVTSIYNLETKEIHRVDIPRQSIGIGLIE